MKSLLTLLVGTFIAVNVHAQGCVAIRHFSCGLNGLQGAVLNTGDLSVGTSYRYFRSFRHFRGHEEEVDRLANNTEVVNYAHAMDVNLSYAITNRAFATLTLPFVVNVRSSLYEHGRDERHSSFSRGLADSRIGVGYWLLTPRTGLPAAAALGVGIKIPSGNHNATDLFYNVGAEGHPEVRPVDQSIQPGDGGVGVTLDFQVYHQITSGLSWYGNGFYLINPRETNGIRTFRETLSPVLENEAIMSVPDQYSVRFGFSYMPSTVALVGSLGLRYEAVPVEDLIGGSDGFRRPGSVLSVEPGLTYTLGGVMMNVSLPFAIVRNRPQSVTDRQTEILTGQPRNGDAAFADYLLNVGFSYTLRGRSETTAVPDTF